MERAAPVASVDNCRSSFVEDAAAVAAELSFTVRACSTFARNDKRKGETGSEYHRSSSEVSTSTVCSFSRPMRT
jgi:hypothetical protein